MKYYLIDKNGNKTEMRKVDAEVMMSFIFRGWKPILEKLENNAKEGRPQNIKLNISTLQVENN